MSLRLRVPWRLTRLGSVYNTMLGVHLRRPLLRRRLLQATTGMPDDITVLIGHRNRPDYRLRNALWSIRTQTYSAGRIRILLVDYASEPAQLVRFRELADQFDAEVFAVGGNPEWNRSHCLNVGLRRVATKFVMISDVDVMLAENYLSEAVAELKRKPLSAVFSPMFHLPESCSPQLEAAAAAGAAIDMVGLLPLGVIKTSGQYSTGRVAGYTHFFHLLHGFDEYYRLYGSEDVDMEQRFLRLGLQAASIHGRSYYLHQWHPKHEGVKSDALRSAIERNAVYLKTTLTLQRNPNGWGEDVANVPTSR